MLPLDHILWAVPDRDEGIAYFEQLTGIRAAIGGSHPGRGTRNALVSLGNGLYFEIIAPDPAQPPVENFGAQIRKLKAPALLTFAVQCPDLETLGAKAAKAGLPFKGPEEWSRDVPDGSKLHWRLGFTEGTAFGNHLPIYIDWKNTPHPSKSTPPGLSLVSFAVMHPDSDALQAVYDGLGIDIRVARSDRPMLRAIIKGPRGELVLNS